MTKLQPLAGERLPGESRKAIVACNDYLRMGVGRSLVAILDLYRETPRNTAPTQSSNTLQKWSQHYEWQKRAETFDAAIDAEKEARRREVMAEGLALDYERVKQLKRLAGLLLDQVYIEDEHGNLWIERDNVWLPDVKQIGGGEYAERVDIVRFNSGILEQLRGTLDDIAKEVGDRRQKVDAEHTVHTAITADDMARARDELNEWKKNLETQKPSGSNVQ